MYESALSAADLPYPPLGLSRDEAARYLGIDVPLFMQLVSDGRMPLPKRLGGFNIWSRIELEAAFIRLPEGAEAQANPTRGQGSSNEMATQERPHVYSPVKLAERWGCSVGHVHKLIELGQLTAFRVGKLVSILTENVEKFEDMRRLEAHEQMPEPAMLEAGGEAKPLRKKAAPRLPYRKKGQGGCVGNRN